MSQRHRAVLGRTIAYLALVVCVLAAGAASARSALAVTVPKTIIGADITTSTVWQQSGSPFLVTAPIKIAAAATLTIEPGVEVQFLKGAGLQIDGALQALGTHPQQIRLLAANDDWAGLQFLNPAGSSLLRSVTLQNAQVGILLAPPAGATLAAAPARIDLFDSLIQSNIVGMSLDYSASSSAARLTMRNNLITANPLGLRVNGLPSGQSGLKLNHNSFVGNGIAVKALNMTGKGLRAQQQWWGDPRGPILLALDSLTCTNSAAPAPGSTEQELVCGTVDTTPASKVPAGRVIVPPGQAIKLESGIGAIAMNDDSVSATSLLTVTVPAGAFEQQVDLLAVPRAFGSVPPGDTTLLEFEIIAAAGGQELHEFAATKQITVEVRYLPTDLDGADANRLVLYYFDERLGVWHFSGITSQPDAANQRFVARLDHLSRMRITSVELFKLRLPWVAVP